MGNRGTGVEHPWLRHGQVSITTAGNTPTEVLLLRFACGTNSFGLPEDFTPWDTVYTAASRACLPILLVEPTGKPSKLVKLRKPRSCEVWI